MTHPIAETVFDALERLLQDLRAGADHHIIKLGALFDAMNERAFGLLLLILALPCCLPFLYIVPQIVALPMLFLAGQMAYGVRAPWLPQKIRNRDIDLNTMQQVVDQGRRRMRWVTALAHARLTFLSTPYASRIIGTLLIIPCASILVPLPSTNTIPGIGVAIVAIGLLERDGLLILGGLLIGLIWVMALAIGGPALLYWLYQTMIGS